MRGGEGQFHPDSGGPVSIEFRIIVCACASADGQKDEPLSHKAAVSIVAGLWVLVVTKAVRGKTGVRILIDPMRLLLVCARQGAHVRRPYYLSVLMQDQTIQAILHTSLLIENLPRSSDVSHVAGCQGPKLGDRIAGRLSTELTPKRRPAILSSGFSRGSPSEMSNITTNHQLTDCNRVSST